jgi:hypothetical protein
MTVTANALTALDYRKAGVKFLTAVEVDPSIREFGPAICQDGFELGHPARLIIWNIGQLQLNLKAWSTGDAVYFTLRMTTPFVASGYQLKGFWSISTRHDFGGERLVTRSMSEHPNDTGETYLYADDAELDGLPGNNAELPRFSHQIIAAVIEQLRAMTAQA